MDNFSEAQLTGGGDTLLHYHLADRVPTHDTLLGVQSVAKVRTISSDYTCTQQDDIVLCDTSAGVVNVTLPPATGGKILIFKKRAANHTLNIYPVGSDTIDDLSVQSLTTKCASITVKAVGFGWMIIAKV
jgi:hypothetical protein